MTTSKNRNGEEMSAGCLVYIASMVVLVPLSGFVVMTLWGWFMAPTFSLPPLSFGESLGVALFVSVVAKNNGTADPGKTQLELAIDRLVNGVFRGCFALGFGFLYLKLFM